MEYYATSVNNFHLLILCHKKLHLRCCRVLDTTLDQSVYMLIWQVFWKIAGAFGILQRHTHLLEILVKSLESCGVLACNFTKDELFHRYFSGNFSRQSGSFLKMRSNFHITVSVNFTAENFLTF